MSYMYTLRHEADADCIILTVKGRVSYNAIIDMAPHVARMSQETGCYKILNDMSTASIDMSFTDIHSSPEVMNNSGVSKSTKRALVLPANFQEAYFLETVTRNYGHNLKVFYDVEKAKEWLLLDIATEQTPSLAKLVSQSIATEQRPTLNQ